MDKENLNDIHSSEHTEGDGTFSNCSNGICTLNIDSYSDCCQNDDDTNSL